MKVLHLGREEKKLYAKVCSTVRYFERGKERGRERGRERERRENICIASIVYNCYILLLFIVNLFA
jgi:hypothetical protein